MGKTMKKGKMGGGKEFVREEKKAVRDESKEKPMKPKPGKMKKK